MENEYIILCFLNEFYKEEDMIVVKEESKNGSIKTLNIFSIIDFHTSHINSGEFFINIIGRDCSFDISLKNINKLNILEYESGLEIDIGETILVLEKF